MTTKFLPLFFIFNIFIVSLFGQIKVNSDGNVGIGGFTSSSSYKFFLVGNFLQLTGSLKTYGEIEVGEYGNRFLLKQNGELKVGDKFIVAENGNVGIGTTSTSNYKLHVAGSLYQRSGIMRTDGEFQVGENGDRFRVDENGDVYIKGQKYDTTSVATKLKNTMPLVIGNDVPSEHSQRFATFYDNTMNNNTRSINFGRSAALFDCGELSFTQSDNNIVSLGFYGWDYPSINIRSDGKVGIGTKNFDEYYNVTVAGNMKVSGIYSSANVGIGGVSDNAKLYVAGKIKSNTFPLVIGNDPTNADQNIFASFYKNTMNDDTPHSIHFGKDNTINGCGVLSYMHSTNYPYTFVSLGVNNNTMSGKLFISETGQVGIGTNDFEDLMLNVNGSASCAQGVWVSSDAKLKENIEPYNADITSKIGKLKAYRYQYKEYDDVNSKDSSPSNTTQKQLKRIGLLANEVKDQFPELVKESKDGTLSLDYMGMIPILLEAIKEIDAKTEHLKVSKKTTDSLVTVINTMDKNYKSLEQRVKALEGCVNCTGNQKSAEYTNIPVETINSLSQNSPNPFSEQTSISFTIADDVKKATIYVYDMQGKQKKSYSITTRGQGSLTIQGYEYVAGMYMYSLVTDGNEVDTKRMILTE